MAEAQGEVTVREIMRSPAPTVERSDSVARVARLMVELGVSGLPVLDGGGLVGIVTETDIVTREAEVDVPPVVPFLDAIFRADAGAPFGEEFRRIVATTAGDLMTTPVYSIRETATLAEVATLLIERGYAQVPVVDDDERLVGLVSRADIVRVVARLEATADG